MPGHSYQISESCFSQDSRYESFGNYLQMSIQWVSCVVFVMMSMLHWTLQGHMVNDQHLTTIVISIRRYSGQDNMWPWYGQSSSALVKCWNFFGGPSVGFKEKRSLPCTATCHFIWTNYWIEGSTSGFKPVRLCHGKGSLLQVDPPLYFLNATMA